MIFVLRLRKHNMNIPIDDIPSLQTTSLMVTRIGGNDFRISPRNLVIIVPHACSDKAAFSFDKKSAFWCSFKCVWNWRLVRPMHSWDVLPEYSIPWRTTSVRLNVSFACMHACKIVAYLQVNIRKYQFMVAGINHSRSVRTSKYVNRR